MLEIAADRYDPSRFDAYAFYASDGANFHNDREAAQAALLELGGHANYVGYIETASIEHSSRCNPRPQCCSSDCKPRRAPRDGMRCRRPSPCGTPSARSSAAAPKPRSSMNVALQGYAGRLETSAHDHGLDYYPVEFEVVPSSFMMEIAVYGLPVRMPHWSFGVRYIHQLVRQSMGHSRIFEVMFPGDPCRAYLVDAQHARREHAGHRARARPRRLREEQPPVRALPGRWSAATSSSRPRRTRTASSAAIEDHGQERVEAVLDAALALEAHVDVTSACTARAIRRYVADARAARRTRLPKRVRNLPGRRAPATCRRSRTGAPIPPQPEYDLLWFIAQYAPRARGVGARHLPARCATNRSTSTPCSPARS